MIVLDASAVLLWLLNGPGGSLVAHRVIEAEQSLHSPHLIDLEIAQVLRRYTSSREISVARAEQALDDLRRVPITRYPHAVLLPRIWKLRSSLTAYDAAYVALAEAIDAPLITADGKLGRSHGHEAEIEVIEP